MMIWAKIQSLWVEIVLGAAIAALLFFLGFVIGEGRTQHKWDQATAKAYQKAQEDAATLADGINEIQVKANEDKATLIAQRDDALRKLRNRPERLPDTAAVACAGTSGRELSRIDAEFLTGYAASAASVASDLAACYGREDKYREAMSANRK